ncbi:MAG: PorT family protein [Prevotellaceae bacterium]|jgi:hypothetical protein|nr:PorT family protein [Prevotellaceae bacterium]
MDDAFEKLIRSKFEDYTAEVDPDGWTKIAAQLPQKSSRKLIRFVVAATATAAAVVALFIVLNTKDQDPKTIQQKSLAEQQLNKTRDYDNQIAPDEADKTVQQSQIQINKAIDAKTKTRKSSEKSTVEPSEENESETESSDKTVTSTRTDDIIAAANKHNVEPAVVAEPAGNLYEPLPEQNKPDDRKPSKNSSEWLLAGNFGTSGSANKSVVNDKIIPLRSNGNNGLLKNYNKAKHAPPLSFGLSVRKNFGKRFGLETGLIYTYLHTNYEDVSASDEKWTSHYLGIPINAIVYVWNSNPKWDIYLSAGGLVEKGLTEKCTETSLVGGNSSTHKYSIDKLQWSMNGAAGVTYKFTKGLGLYLEPKASYCFKAQSQHSIRNDWPLAIGINAGLRLDL